MVQMAEGAGLAVLPGSSRGGGNLPAAAKLVIGVVLLLVLCSAESGANGIDHQGEAPGSAPHLIYFFFRRRTDF